MPDFDTSVPHIARVYDYWLGGKDNFAADRELGERTLQAYPNLAFSVRANRAFLARTVRFLAAEAGIRQFLDIGTGIPTNDNTHEVAQRVAPESRIVYVDNDPIVLSHARALLTSKPEGACAYIDADLRDPDKILAGAADTLDFTRPVAVMLLAVLQFAPDDEAGAIVRRLMDACGPGSFVVISHPASDIDAEPHAEMVRRMNESLTEKVTLRDRAGVARLFAGLDLVEPGLVRVPEWRPDSNHQAASPAVLWGGVAAKVSDPARDQAARLPDGGDLRDAGAVSQVGVRRRVQQDQVGPGPGAEVADVGAEQRPGAARGGGPDRLFGGHPHLADRERDAERHAGGERGARIAVGGQGHRDARVEQPARVGERLPGAELRAGQQGRHHRRRGQRVHVGVRQERAVVSRRGARRGRYLDAGARSELVGVHPGEQARGAARREHRGGLVRAERSVLAEHVDPAGRRRAGVQHRTAHQVDVTGRVGGELGRHDVRAEVGDLGGDLGGERQPARLVRHGEPVPGLALERGRALAEHLGRQPPQVGAQHRVGGGAGRLDRDQDAARPVEPARHPGGELGAALPGEDQVSVRVGEPGQHGPAARVHRGVRGRRPGRGPGPGHRAVGDDQRRVLARGEPARRVPVVGDQLADAGDQRALRMRHSTSLPHPASQRSPVRGWGGGGARRRAG